MNLPPVIQKILSFVVFRQGTSNDHLEAYPERLHVSALPERRYLKTARFLVIASLLSITFNFAMCFIYIRNASNVQTVVQNPYDYNTYLYYLDYYNKELRPVEKPERVLDVGDLVFQNLITDYLNERYQMTSNGPEMLARWGTGGKVAAYAPKLYEPFTQEANVNLQRQSRGITQEIYIYAIKNLDGNNFYEVIFDVYSLNESGYGAQKCPCRDKTPECLACMRGTAVDVKRYKAYMRVGLNVGDISPEVIRRNINPYYFRIYSYYPLPQVIRPGNPWEDVDLMLDN